MIQGRIHMIMIAEHLQNHLGPRLQLLQHVQILVRSNQVTEEGGFLRLFLFFRSGTGDHAHLREPLQKTAEFQFREQVHQLPAVRLSDFQIRRRNIQRYIRPDFRQFPAHESQLSVFLHFLTQLCPGNLIGMGQQIRHRAELLQQLDPRLLTDPRNPRQIVRLVSHETLQINELLRCEFISLFHLLRIIQIELRNALPGDQYMGSIGRQLQRILVPGDNQRLQALCFTHLRNGADDIIRFETVCFQIPDSHSSQDLLHNRHFHGQFCRHFPPPRLVLVVRFMPEGGRLPVPCHRHVSRIVIIEDLQQHIQESEDSLGIHALLRNHRALHGIVRTVDQTVSVNYDDPVLHRNPFCSGIRIPVLKKPARLPADGFPVS